jgi:hypothetical protein
MWRSLPFLFLLLVAQVAVQADQEHQRPYLYCQKKWGELKWEGLKIQVLKLRAEKFPVGKTYTLFIQNCDGSETQIFNYTANKKGHLIVDITEELKKGAPFAITPLRKGEKVSYCMYSPDRSEKFTASIIPFPLQASKDFTSIALELVDTNADSFLCVGKGFIPGEQVKLTCVSGAKVTEEWLTIDEKGEFQQPVSPRLEGQETGKAKVSVKRKYEEIKLPFSWGRQGQEFVGAICLQIS